VDDTAGSIDSSMNRWSVSAEPSRTRRNRIGPDSVAVFLGGNDDQRFLERAAPTHALLERAHVRFVFGRGR
jgi:hypothetical protein